MTTSPASADEAARLEQLRALSNLLPRFMRLAQAHKSQLTTSEGRDRAAHVLLFPIARLAPVRQGALAELVHADPSTVSRHVTTLVERGLVRRVADETDGRASRLVITDAGHSALQELCTERENRLGQALAEWDDAELATFAQLFTRLIDDLETGLTGSAACQDQQIPAPASPRGTR